MPLVLEFYYTHFIEQLACISWGNHTCLIVGELSRSRSNARALLALLDGAMTWIERHAAIALAPIWRRRGSMQHSAYVMLSNAGLLLPTGPVTDMELDVRKLPAVRSSSARAGAATTRAACTMPRSGAGPFSCTYAPSTTSSGSLIDALLLVDDEWRRAWCELV